MPTIEEAQVGTRIWFVGEKQPYRVRARNARYLVCTKPFNLQRTVLYTIVDLEEGIRGTENLIFCMGAESDQDCREMIERLEGKRASDCPDLEATEVSRRNRVPLNVYRVA